MAAHDPRASGSGAKMHQLEKCSRENRDLLRFMFQTTAKGGGKGFQDWLESWKQCKQASVNCDANSEEGAMHKVFFYFSHSGSVW